MNASHRTVDKYVTRWNANYTYSNKRQNESNATSDAIYYNDLIEKSIKFKMYFEAALLFPLSLLYFPEANVPNDQE